MAGGARRTFTSAAELRAKASTNFARAARLVLRAVVFGVIAFDLMLGHRVLTATTVFIFLRHLVRLYQSRIPLAHSGFGTQTPL